MNEFAALDCGFDNIIASLFNNGNVEMPKLKQFDYPSETEVFSKDSKMFYRVALPGIDEKDIDLSVENNVLKIKAERKRPNQVDEGEWYSRSFHYGILEQTYTLPQDANPEEVTADFKNGVLEIRVPRTIAPIPRKIEIKQLESAAV
jgi:HSP20 family protein